MEAEYCLELALYVGRNGEEPDLERVLLVEGRLEVRDEDTDQASELFVDLADVVVDCADALGEVLVDAGEEVTVNESISQRNDGERRRRSSLRRNDPRTSQRASVRSASARCASVSEAATGRRSAEPARSTRCSAAGYRSRCRTARCPAAAGDTRGGWP